VARCLIHPQRTARCLVCTLIAIADDHRITAHAIETAEGPMWVLLTPAEPGLNAWPEPTIAHCLDVDVVAQGPTRADALALLVEAITLCIEDDRAAGRDVRDRRTTPSEDWRQLANVVLEAHRRRNVAPPVRASLEPDEFKP